MNSPVDANSSNNTMFVLATVFGCVINIQDTKRKSCLLNSIKCPIVTHFGVTSWGDKVAQ